MRLEIRKMGINGEGIGYDHGKPVFIKGALMHEIVDVQIEKEFERYKIGKLLKIIKKSNERIKPLCPYQAKCGACSLMHTNYQNQLRYKKHVLKQALKKYADIEMPINIIPSENPFYYRNKLKLPFNMNNDGIIVTGMYEVDTNHFKTIGNCIIHEEILEKVRKEILSIMNKYQLKAYDEKTKEGYRTLIMRTFNGKISLVFVVGDNTDINIMLSDLSKIGEISSIYYTINTNKKYINAMENELVHIYGKKVLNAKIAGLKLVFTPKSFYQLNTKQSEVLYNEVISYLDESDEEVLEAYCGVGVMSLLASKKVKHVTGVEIIPDALDNASKNAFYNKITNVDFIVGDSGTIMEENFKDKKLDCLIVDPPRTGLDEKMLASIIKSEVKKIIYVSCNPSTLAKNINDLKDYYKVSSIKAIDIFSQTEHVETIALLFKLKTDKHIDCDEC